MYVDDVESDLSGCEALLEALKTLAISNISFGNCFMGPTALSTLAKFIVDIATIRGVNFSGNPIVGSKKETLSGVFNEDIDKTLDGFLALCEAFKASSIQNMDLSNCGLGPKALSTLAIY